MVWAKISEINGRLSVIPDLALDDAIQDRHQQLSALRAGLGQAGLEKMMENVTTLMREDHTSPWQPVTRVPVVRMENNVDNLDRSMSAEGSKG